MAKKKSPDTDSPLRILLLEACSRRVEKISFMLEQAGSGYCELIHLKQLPKWVARVSDTEIDLVLLGSVSSSQTLADRDFERILETLRPIPVMVLNASFNQTNSPCHMVSECMDIDEVDTQQFLDCVARVAGSRAGSRSFRPTELLYGEMIDYMADTLLVVDDSGEVQYMNRSGENLFRTTRKEMLGQQFGFPIASEGNVLIDLHGWTAQPVVAEMRVAKFENLSKPFWVASLRDITALKKSEESLRLASRRLSMSLLESEESKQRINAVLSSVPDGLFFTDVHNHIVMRNPAAVTLLQETSFQKEVDDNGNLIKNSNIYKIVAETFSDKKHIKKADIELPEVNSAHHRVVRVTCSVVEAADGTAVGTVTLIRDVTEKRAIERMKTEIITTVAHELKTPLTSVKGYTEILLTRENLGEDRQRRYLQIIIRQADTMNRLITDMLDLALIETGTELQLTLTDCDITAVIADVIQKTGENIHHEFKVDMEEGLPMLRIDREKIFRVLDNLITNAVKFSPQHSQIVVSARKKHSSVIVAVQDSGIGISEEEIERIFERFYRIDGSSTAREGIGIGMSIVKSFVEAHGGTVSIESALGEGTIVSFHLPCTSADI